MGSIWRERSRLGSQQWCLLDQVNQSIEKALRISMFKTLCAQILTCSRCTCPASFPTYRSHKARRPTLRPNDPFSSFRACECPTLLHPSLKPHRTQLPAHLWDSSPLPRPLPGVNTSSAVSRIHCIMTASLYLCSLMASECPAPGTRSGSRLTSKNFS